MAAEQGHLVALAEAVADGQVIDWAEAESSARTPEERQVVRHLRLLAGVADVHRSPLDTRRGPVDPDVDVSGGTWGPLEIKQCIGGGSFGMVYRAWDPRLARDVALKLLRREPDEEQASTIIEEGRLLARVRHPHVITVYGASRFDGRVGIWMEYIRGRTLEQVITEDGPLGAREAALVGTELCSALAAVHQQGVVHRDIKAHNVMREAGGRNVLMDFGAGEDPAAPARPGSVAGTPLYMAPELFTGSKATPGSDLYSLGVLLFRLVTAKYPVSGRTVDEVRAAHARKERLHLRDLRPDLPSGFIKSVERALAPNPADRVESAGALEAALSAEVLSDSTRSGEVLPSSPQRSVWPRLVAAAALLAIVAGGTFWALGGGRSAPPPGPPTIAVQPFKNHTGDPSQQYFAAGLTDVLLAQLGGIAAMRVVALSDPPSGGATLTIEEMAAKYPAAFAVLDGSVGRGGGRVRVSARLVQLASGAILWGQSYDGSDTDVFALQGQIAADLARQLNVSMNEAESARLKTPVAMSADAQDAYLRAEYLLDSLKAESFKEARTLFERAVALEPRFAAAHAGLARTFLALGGVGELSPDDAATLARAAANTALSIDPASAEAALAVADVTFRVGWNWPEAERQYRAAVALNPSRMEARSRFARFLAAAGRVPEALREAQDAAALDPWSDEMHNVVGLMLFYDRRYDEAIAHLRPRLSADSPHGRIMVARSLAAKRQFPEALAEMRTTIEIAGNNTGYDAELARMLADSGNPDEARHILAGLEARRAAGTAYIAPQDLAYILIPLGDYTRAFALFNQAVDEHGYRLLWLGVDPRVDPIRGDPRFTALIRRLGIPSNR